MRAVKAHPDLQLQVVAGASAVLDRYGAVVEIMERDGFAVDAKLFMLVEGETPATMAKSTGLGLIELPTIFETLEPDVVLTVGDRFETMATTLAAAYMNIPLAHTMGGEVSGNIDENIRHAVTKFANIHFPACEDARERIIRLGERPETVHNTGCPRMDIVAEILKQRPRRSKRSCSPKASARSSRWPTGSFWSRSIRSRASTAKARRRSRRRCRRCRSNKLPAIVLWPNADAGSEDVSRGIRKYRERNPDAPFHYVKNLPPEIYLPLMARTRCLVGNSSSAIREGAFIGTPSVNIGSRQTARQRGDNVVDADYDRGAIADAIADRIAAREVPDESDLRRRQGRPAYRATAGDGEDLARQADHVLIAALGSKADRMQRRSIERRERARVHGGAAVRHVGAELREFAGGGASGRRSRARGHDGQSRGGRRARRSPRDAGAHRLGADRAAVPVLVAGDRLPPLRRVAAAAGGRPSGCRALLVSVARLPVQLRLRISAGFNDRLNQSRALRQLAFKEGLPSRRWLGFPFPRSRALFAVLRGTLLLALAAARAGRGAVRGRSDPMCSSSRICRRPR